MNVIRCYLMEAGLYDDFLITCGEITENPYIYFSARIYNRRSSLILSEFLYKKRSILDASYHDFSQR